jgi:tripartite-type tricarboxylate transporter receptor subunit TctC
VLVGTTPGSIVVVPLANKDVKYTLESFMPIAPLSEGGMMLVINASSPWKNLKELVEYSKKNPDMITISSSGALGITHLLAEIFANEAAVKWRHIPYQGSGPAITALLGNHVPTIKELGYSVGSPALYGISAPKGTLREVVDAIFAAAKKVNEKYGDSIAANLSLLGAETRLLGPDEYAAYLQGQKKLFRDGIQSLK